MKEKLKNNFGLNEWSGAIGDLGTTLPLAFALMVYNGFPPDRLFFLWGLTYIFCGLYYKVPVSVQPLKAMSVIALASGFSPSQLATAGVLYGLLMILLAFSGTIEFLQRLFSRPLVRGIQLGVGLILAHKAVELVFEKGILLHDNSLPIAWAMGLVVVALMLLFWLPLKWHAPLTALLISVSVGLVRLLGLDPIDPPAAAPIAWARPDFGFFFTALVYLILPQLPLTLGNAVFAANDACHALWGQQSCRVTPKRLSLSIGLSDLAIGLFGGFPICHGAGGMAAHARFGARTGGAVIIIGALFVTLALVPNAAALVFYIPVPVLAALLLGTSWQLVFLSFRLENRADLAIAALVGLTSFLTRNLALALLAGFLAERIFVNVNLKKLTPKEEQIQ